MRQILFFSSEKKIKNKYADKDSDGVGNQITPVARAAEQRDGFLHDFGQSTVGDADDDGKDDGFSPVVLPVGYELFAIAPEAGKGETCIHDDMGHLVETDGRFDAGKQRTRESG